MEIMALVGKSGTGKSYKAMMIAKERNINYIIDDGLFISGTKIIAGKSAKRENSTVSAVKRALFMNKSHKEETKTAINKIKPSGILILGTSDKMVRRIAENLELPQITKTIYISDVSTDEEIKLAHEYRNKEGKHVIPVPTFEVKKDFSGYFIDTLRIFKKRESRKEDYFEKTVVRPTFSYFGKYIISPKVVKDLTKHATTKVTEITRISNVYVKNQENGIRIQLDIEVIYGKSIIMIAQKAQRQIITEVESMTALNILAVDIFVKKMIKT
ncbi:MAG: Asp23/Gls24 family envelope stress response protein [Firmicutes bacterium]|nr:Asp23/Gls24 family envelope stress response protein [Bacillota bacterium]